MAWYGKAPSVLIGALALSFLANLTLIAATALDLYTVNPGGNRLPLTPDGIGLGKTAFNALFALTGMRGGADALLSLRIWSLLVGALGLLNYIFGMGRIVHGQKDHPGADQVASLKVNSSIK